jgi:hypothetical protein
MYLSVSINNLTFLLSFFNASGLGIRDILPTHTHTHTHTHTQLRFSSRVIYSNFFKVMQYVLSKKTGGPFYFLFRQKIRPFKIKKVDRIKRYSVFEYAKQILGTLPYSCGFEYAKHMPESLIPGSGYATGVPESAFSCARPVMLATFKMFNA